MSVVESSLPGVLRERASFQPNDKALTFIDYERSWDGVEETLTWSQLYRRTLNLAAQLREHGSTGDRALILAPQSLDYVVSFIASLQAGIVAVPLSIPQGGAHDERTVSVFADTAPAIVLTASSVVDNVVEYVQPQPGQNAPAVIEVDRLDLDARPSSVLVLPLTAIRISCTCSTPRVPRARRPVSWSRIRIFSPISNKL